MTLWEELQPIPVYTWTGCQRTETISPLTLTAVTVDLLLDYSTNTKYKVKTHGLGHRRQQKTRLQQGTFLAQSATAPWHVTLNLTDW